MRKPLIGITADLENEKYVLKAAYVGMVVAAGGVPALVPPLRDLAPDQVDRYDGLILSGGDDIDTEPFGIPLHPAARTMDPRRQAGEFALLAALDQHPDIPVLGICLGHQIMGLHAGGQLIQHLPEALPTGTDHGGNRKHPVSGELGSGTVTSHHHQGLADAGRLEVIARAPDGLIEAVADRRRRFYIGVQWHPERTVDPTLGLGVIRRVVDAARSRQ